VFVSYIFKLKPDSSRPRPYQSITNWFRSQRDQRREHDIELLFEDPSHKSREPLFGASPSEIQSFSAVSSDYSFVPPAPSSHPPQSAPVKSRPSPPISLPAATFPTINESISLSRRSTPRRSSTPYRSAGGGTGSTNTRPRRTRPEPYQLDALRNLFNRTSTPSIEERTILALEIGM
jgi:hypothetical protein